MKYNRVQDELLKVNNLACSGLIAISLVILQVFIGLKPLSLSALISVVAFSVAIPLLAGNIFMNAYRRLIEREDRHLGLTIGFAIDIIGLTAAFWYASWIAAILFFIISIALVIYFCIFVRVAYQRHQ